jgi:S1-C subfamily serine protease/predicted esterase
MTRTAFARSAPLAALAAGLFLCAGTARGQDLGAAEEKAIKAAAARVAPSVVQITTSGGTEIVGGGKGPEFLKGSGSATGLVVAADGYVITSTFHFAHRPTEIFVSVSGRKQRYPARVVATDHTRMLTLLRVEESEGVPAKDLPVPIAFPKKDLLVGQWALALGRTLDPDVNHPPSISAGIISATDRIWGKAIQTDAKVSPTNYGGPLVSIDGRVFGVLVPLSPRGTGEIAGFDWYDSGIGFAIPLEDVLARLPALVEGKDLRAGLLGIVPKKPTDQYQSRVEVGSVQPDSAAAKAGIQADDLVVAIDGKPVANLSALRHAMEPKYAGDTITIKVQRGDKELEFKDVTLLASSTAFANGFLGVLPLRDDPGPGVPLRYVYPDSPAAKAGLAEGDRIMKVGPVTQPPRPFRPVANREALAEALAPLPPGTEVKIEVKRKDGKVETVNAVLGPVPAGLPEKLPQPSSAGKALEGQKKGAPGFPMEAADPDTCGSIAQDDPKKDPPKGKTETGFLQRTSTAKDRSYWLSVPENYDPNVSHGLIVYFHPIGGAKEGEQKHQLFRQFCKDAHFIVMGPQSVGPEGWVPSESDGVVQDVKAVMAEYTIDRSRVIAHGNANGGQMAFYVGFGARDTFRGVAVVGAALGTTPGENLPGQPLAFFIAAGEKDPNLKQIEAGKGLLEGKKFPVVYRVMKDAGNESLDAKTFAELQVWMDSLDRL